MLISWLLLFFLIVLFFQLSRSKKQPKPKKESYQPNNIIGSSQAKIFPLFYKTSNKPFQKPLEIPNENRGRSEDFFLAYLWKYFPTNIYVDIALPIKDEFYYPDFAFIDKKHKLFIDIEIDEPYAIPFGQPTHYLGSDEIRNRFFLEQGWWVIRFTEEQIIREPKSCCKFIAQQVAQATQNSKILSPFFNVDDLSIQQRQWTKAQSEQMFKHQYRESYGHLLKAKK